MSVFVGWLIIEVNGTMQHLLIILFLYLLRLVQMLVPVLLPEMFQLTCKDARQGSNLILYSNNPNITRSKVSFHVATTNTAEQCQQIVYVSQVSKMLEISGLLLLF